MPHLEILPSAQDGNVQRSAATHDLTPYPRHSHTVSITTSEAPARGRTVRVCRVTPRSRCDQIEDSPTATADRRRRG